MQHPNFSQPSLADGFAKACSRSGGSLEEEIVALESAVGMASDADIAHRHAVATKQIFAPPTEDGFGPSLTRRQRYG
jgi:hypothetical protein